MAGQSGRHCDCLRPGCGSVLALGQVKGKQQVLIRSWCFVGIFQVMGMGFGPHAEKGGKEVSTAEPMTRFDMF